MEIPTFKIPEIGIMRLVEAIGSAIFIFITKPFQKIVCHSHERVREKDYGDFMRIADIECRALGVTIWRKRYFAIDNTWSKDDWYDDSGVEFEGVGIKDAVTKFMEMSKRMARIEEMKSKAMNAVTMMEKVKP